MYRAILASVVLLFLTLSGCSAANQYGSQIKVGLKALNELNFALKKIQDPDKSSGPIGEVREITNKLKEIKTQIDAAAPQDEKVKERVLKFYSPILEPILDNITEEQKRIRGIANVSLDPATAEVVQSYKTLERREKKTN